MRLCKRGFAVLIHAFENKKVARNSSWGLQARVGSPKAHAVIKVPRERPTAEPMTAVEGGRGILTLGWRGGSAGEGGGHESSKAHDFCFWC